MPLSVFADHIGYAINTQVTRRWSGYPSTCDDIGVFSFGQLFEGTKGNLSLLPLCNLRFDDAVFCYEDAYRSYYSIFSVYIYEYACRIKLFLDAAV